jgi:hypothetical protein
MRALKAGALYFALAFAAGWVFGPIRELWVIPRFGRTVGYLFEAPLMLIVMVGAARWVVRRFAVRRLSGTAAVGVVALGLLVTAEVSATRWLRGLSLSEYVAGFRSIPGAISLVLFLLFAAMPMLVGRPPAAR